MSRGASGLLRVAGACARATVTAERGLFLGSTYSKENKGVWGQGRGVPPGPARQSGRSSPTLTGWLCPRGPHSCPCPFLKAPLSGCGEEAKRLPDPWCLQRPLLGRGSQASRSASPASFSVLQGLASGCLPPATVGLAPTPTELHPSMKLSPLASIIALYFSTDSSSRQEGVPSIGVFAAHANKICLPLSHSPSARS